MLTHLKIQNVALIDSVEVEFGPGLNLLTGETGSGKSIIVDSLAALTGDRVSSDIIKSGAETARIEGVFALPPAKRLLALLDEAGIDAGSEMIIRRDISAAGKNRVFVNDQAVTVSLLKRIGNFLVNIHGQGEHATLMEAASHIDLLDDFAGLAQQRKTVAEAFHHWSVTKTELGMLRQNEAEKLQMLDILRFQVEEIERAALREGEPEELEEEKRRLSNVEKLTSLTDETYRLLYEEDASTLTTLEKAARKVDELSTFDPRFQGYLDTLAMVKASLEDLAFAARDFRSHLEFSPERLAAIEDRLAEISRLSRKYGSSVRDILAHLADAKNRIENIETSEYRELELQKSLEKYRAEYLASASDLSSLRRAAAPKFEKEVEKGLKMVALEKARFLVGIETAAAAKENDSGFTGRGIDRVEFLFSANPGEDPKPLTKVASGGEASRLTLVLKTAAKQKDEGKAIVFDEIDAGIGGRVAQAVGQKLKTLARGQQVLCVTHQPQVASLADRHYLVEKKIAASRTSIAVRELDAAEKVEEVARMLAGEKITDAARENAREMLAASS